MTERELDENQVGDPSCAALLGVMYEYGIGEDIEVDKNAAERCYYIAEKGGIKYIPIIKHLQQYNYSAYSNFMDIEENLFFNLMPPVMTKIATPEIRKILDELSPEEIEQIQKISTIGISHCCSKGYPFSRLMLLGALSNKDELIGEGKHMNIMLADTALSDKNNSKAQLWVYYDAYSGDQDAIGACNWFKVSFG